MANTKVTNNIFNDYTIAPRNLTQYTALRGVTDFSQIGMFEQYEKGYQFLSVIKLPTFMEKLGDKFPNSVGIMNQNFRQTMEMEFRGLDGLPDMQADTLEITDGINTQRMINRVTQETSVEVSMQYFEKHGSMFTKYQEYYLTGIRDNMTQARTYHGLIAGGDLAPSYENEVFTFLYYVTDSTMLRLERAVLLANAQFTNAGKSMYNGSKDNITNNEITLSFTCFPIYGAEVDKAAKYLLEHEITGVSYDASKATYDNTINMANNRINGGKLVASPLDSSDYTYGVMRSDEENHAEPNPSKIPDLVRARGYVEG